MHVEGEGGDELQPREELELGRYSNDMHDVVMQQNSITCSSTASSSRRKWPMLFWIILKFLCVFYHRDLISCRKCLACRLNCLRKGKRFMTVYDISRYKWNRRRVPRKGTVIPSLAAVYEMDVCEERNEETTHLLESSDQDENCDACDTQWWDCDGQVNIYTTRDIGGRCWNHTGSGLLSILLHMGCLGTIIYDATYYLPEMWADSSQTLHLINKASFFIIASTVPFISLCSKVRSVFVEEIPYLSCTSVFNVRYLVKRAQFMNLHERGLPGKPFLGLCLVLPVICTLYRGAIYIFLSQCDLDVHAVLTTIAGIFFFETIGCFMYILYLIRVSFQHQFSLLLQYVMDQQGELDKCRSALFHVASDFSCFKEFCTMYEIITLPVAALALASNVSFQYMVHRLCQQPKDATVLHIENHIGLHVWVMALLLVFALTFALGGFSVDYLWQNFREDVEQLQTDEFSSFWKKLIHQLRHLNTQTNTVTLTLVISVLTFFKALQLDNQDVSFLAQACNSTNPNITSHYCK